MVSCPDPDELERLAQEEINKPKPDKFWDKDIIEYAFSEKSVRSELERLMGTGIVRVTDRAYMQRLQQRIEEDHVAKQQQRIAQREADEVEREMDLVLKGEIPVEEAPKELADHPVLVNAQIIKRISEQKMPKKRRRRLAAVTARCFYPAPAAMTAAEEAVLEAGEPPPLPADVIITLPPESLDPQPGELEADPAAPGYLLSPEQYEKLKYESPLIKQLRQVETVEELYRLADEIVGLRKASNAAG